MNDLPELVAIPNLILAALRNPYGFTEADLRFARLHAADQIEAARRAIRAYYDALAVGKDARAARDVAFLKIVEAFGLSPNVANEARKTYERSMCPHEHAVNDWRLHPLTPNAEVTGAPLAARPVD